MELPATLSGLLALGLPGILIVATVEKLVPVIPSYVLYVFLGMAFVGHPGELAAVLAVSVAGSLLGGLCWYGVGRAIGEHRIEAAVRRYGRYVLLGPAMFDRLRRAYRRNDVLVTAFGHAIPVVRFYLPIPAGVLALRPFRFLAASAAGCVAWNGLLLGLGFGLAGTGLPPVQVGIAAVIALLAVEFGAAAWIARHRRRRNDTLAQPEPEALPG